VGASESGRGLAELETLWLIKYITDAGGTPTTNAPSSTLWREAVSSLGKTPSNFLNDNKIIFYTNAA
jgi:hypothetical protein